MLIHVLLKTINHTLVRVYFVHVIELNVMESHNACTYILYDFGLSLMKNDLGGHQMVVQ